MFAGVYSRLSIWITLLILPLFFNNCSGGPDLLGSSEGSKSPSQEVLSSVGGGNGFNGGGYSGKVTYHNFGGLGQCQEDDLSSSIAFASGEAKVINFDCQGGTTSAGAVNINSLLMNTYDPHFLVYNELIYASESILDPAYHMAFPAYCFNVNYADPQSGIHGLDFAVKSTRLKSVPGKRKKVGMIIFGRVDQGPLLEESELISPDQKPDGSRTMYASSGEYQIDFGPRYAPTRAQAVVRFKNGPQVPMECILKKFVSDE